MANGVGGALLWIELFSTFGQALEFLPALTEGSYSVVDFPKVALDEIGDLPAGSASLVAEVEDAGDAKVLFP